MAEINSIENKEHLITLRNRKVLAVNGVYEVVSFDESSVVMKTVCGELVIEGDGLHISELDTSNGVIAIDGCVESLTYYESKANEKKSIFGRSSK